MSPSQVPSADDIRALRRDKYGDDPRAEESEAFQHDLVRLAAGEPLAYVIGWIPFLGLHIGLDSRPLIPRPETEWWTEQLVAHLREKFDDRPFTFLDLCAGSGCIGLAILKEFPYAHVSFGELVSKHAALIQKNLAGNGLDASRANIRTSDLFDAFDSRFDIIATNPPYIPEDRELDVSVIEHEPSKALFAGIDGLELVRRIIADAPIHLLPGGELWVECDISNIDAAKELATSSGFSAAIRSDQYGRPRFVVAYLEI